MATATKRRRGEPGTQTAEVETLTAEVRVLTVGNRQVTLSLFRQLDWLEQGDSITSFGRVNDPQYQREQERRKNRTWDSYYDDDAYVVVVGKSTLTGGLIRARFTRRGDREEFERLSALPLIVLAGLT